MWTFGKKIAAGFALSFVVLVGVGVVAYRSITALARRATRSLTRTSCSST